MLEDEIKKFLKTIKYQNEKNTLFFTIHYYSEK